MRETPNERKKRKKNPIGMTIAAIVLGAACVTLGVGIASFFLWQEESEFLTPQVDTEFQANAQTYAGSSSGVYSGQIKAGSGAVAPSPTPTPSPSPTPIPSPTPVLSPAVSPTNIPEQGEGQSGTQMPSGDFIFPDSASRVLTENDLARLTDAASCQRAINEIFARHGYEFHANENSADYEYFNSKSWYQSLTKKDQEDVLAEFSDIEASNVGVISSYRTAQGW